MHYCGNECRSRSRIHLVQECSEYDGRDREWGLRRYADESQADGGENAGDYHSLYIANASCERIAKSMQTAELIELAENNEPVSPEIRPSRRWK